MSFITPIISEVNTLTKTVRLVYAFLLTLYKLLSCNSVSPPAQCLQDVLIWMADSTFFKCLPRKMRINPRLWEMTNLKQVWRTISSKGYYGLWFFFFFSPFHSGCFYLPDKTIRMPTSLWYSFISSSMICFLPVLLNHPLLEIFSWHHSSSAVWNSDVETQDSMFSMNCFDSHICYIRTIHSESLRDLQTIFSI